MKLVQEKSKHFADFQEYVHFMKVVDVVISRLRLPKGITAGDRQSEGSIRGRPENRELVVR